MNKFAALLVFPLVSACSGKHDVACDGDAAKAVITSNLRTALAKQISDLYGKESSTTAYGVDTASIRASAGKLRLRLEEVLTTKSDPDSTRKFCRATLKIEVPSDTIKDADAARDLMGYRSTADAAARIGLEFDGVTIAAPFDYSVQPTDDGKKIIGTVDVANAGTVLASTVVAESLMKGALEKREAERKLEEKQAAEARARKLADAEREQSQNHASGTATTAAPVMAQASASKVGQRTYEQVCATCHAVGVAGAPKLGDREAWTPRLKEGMEVVHAYALRGKGVMPPKGGYAGPDADVIAAADYMIGAAR